MATVKSCTDARNRTVRSVVVMSDYLHCWEWTRNPDAHTGPAVDYWSKYPGAAEEYDTHEVQIVFWDAPDESDHD